MLFLWLNIFLAEPYLGMNSEFSIIDDNQYFVVINKAHNVDFHTIDGQLGVVELVKQYLGVSLFPVHRLDRMTSGLMVLAKSKEVAAQFGELFSQRRIEKYYIALSDKKPKRKQGLIKGDMKKGRNGSYLLLKSMLNPAITQFLSFSLAPSLRGYLLKPHTGKTHQLRVAMKSNASPIIGDNRYYPNCSQQIGCLHAWQLKFEIGGCYYAFQAAPDWNNQVVVDWLSELQNSETVVWPNI